MILITPGTFSAALVSILTIRPLGIVLTIRAPYARFGAGNSAEYFAAPVTFSLPSTRVNGSPSTEGLADPTPAAPAASMPGRVMPALRQSRVTLPPHV